ncbi:conserved Plasmodium protein, unknown function [Plasmodium gallinaceum]|uniref:Uncharacterized protein n=1 Tax=Plasmodium gallinaceum TaxID=5849 RepID=A0A1J1GLQ9_PLAGA|nr:conserved Plasmodium protein, unknown function [Plasmodium gallinaceum]CRG93259.1 conserved Plasmodium protein, unknown function [Plasmodium gallinaceum]
MNHVTIFLRKLSTKNVNSEDLNILKKKIRYRFKSVGMLELDTIINNYLNVNMNKIDKDKVNLLYNLVDIDTSNLLKLFYFYSNKQNHNVDKLSHYLKNKDKKEITDTFKLLIDILNHNEKFLSSQ